MRHSFLEALLKAVIVLVPSYTAAYLTEKMVWTLPTLVASSFFAATIKTGGKQENRVDEDDGDSDIESMTDG